jgi:transposase
MGKALSVDLRRRVVDAVERGMSRRRAAVRFGVSASSAIRWTARAAATGEVAPRKQGGDRKSERIEAHAAFILTAIASEPDITLAELQRRLVRERGDHFGIGTLWRFFDRRGITFKKRRRVPPSWTARTS